MLAGEQVHVLTEAAALQGVPGLRGDAARRDPHARRAVPKPRRVRLVRSACRLSRSDSGTENTTTSQPSASVARGRPKIRTSPSASASRVGAVRQ